LDLSAQAAWTIEFFFYDLSNASQSQTIFAMGWATNGSNGFNGIRIVAPGSNQCVATIYGEVSGPGISPTCNNLTPGVWHHVALCKRPNQGGPSGDQYQLFVDGIGSGWTRSDIPFVGPYPPWEGYYTLSGYYSGPGGYSAFIGGESGYYSEARVTPKLTLYEVNFTPPTAPDTLGVPNTLDTPTPPNGFAPVTYLGIARGLHDWASYDNQYWVAIGTHLKLYLVNNGTLFDITPVRNTANLNNAISTVNNSANVNVTDNGSEGQGHQANTGDFIDFPSPGVTVGGITLLGTYQLSVVDPFNYTIVAATAATSTVTDGGGAVTINYEMYTGLGANGELLGYGTGEYGEGTYGTPRPAGTGVAARMRTWSLENYGQDLIASESDGEIYWWQKLSGPNSPAAILANAPLNVQRCLVDAAQRVIIACGSTDITSAYDPLLVSWCSLDDIEDWVPTDVNTAGDYQLTAGSRIITASKTQGQNLIWTDTTLYRMVYVGGTDIYDFYPCGRCYIVGPNACVDVDGVNYFMGFDNIYNYSGTLNLQACDVWETVFDPNYTNANGKHTALDRTQSESVVCYTLETKTEITWLYPSIDQDALTVTFSGTIDQGATSTTLAAAWTGATGLYNLVFSDQEAQVVSLTNGETTAEWVLPLLNNVSATAEVIGNDRYVSFNWEDGTWYAGDWNRTCAQGRAPAMGGYPYGVNAGYLYQHEIGTDAVEAAGTVAIPWYMESLDITIGGAKSEYTMGGSDARFAIGGSDSHLCVRSMLPDWQYMTGEMNLTLLSKDRPQDAQYVVDGPVAFDVTDAQIDIDAHGSQIVIRLDNLTAEGGAPSLGSNFRMGVWQGLAFPYAKR